MRLPVLQTLAVLAVWMADARQVTGGTNSPSVLAGSITLSNTIAFPDAWRAFTRKDGSFGVEAFSGNFSNAVRLLEVAKTGDKSNLWCRVDAFHEVTLEWCGGRRLRFLDGMLMVTNGVTNSGRLATPWGDIVQTNAGIVAPPPVDRAALVVLRTEVVTNTWQAHTNYGGPLLNADGLVNAVAYVERVPAGTNYVINHIVGYLNGTNEVVLWKGPSL